MIKIGALGMRKNPETLKRLHALALVALSEGVTFFYFSPSGVDFEREKIEGFYIDKNKWVKREYDFPNIIINLAPPNTDKQEDIYNKLWDIVPFTSFSIGTKSTVNNIISKSELFSKYIPKAISPKSIDELLQFIEDNNKIVIKPDYGSKGENVHIIFKEEDKYILKSQSNIKLKKDQFIRWLEQVEINKYIAQVYVNSRTKNNLKMDFRLHTQKGKNLEWLLTTIYPRISSEADTPTNLSLGGYTTTIKDFLMDQFIDKHLNIFNLLKVFAVQFSTFLDDYYENILDELGIDVGIDEAGKIWIYEVNWRPGTPPNFYGELNREVNTIDYCIEKVKKSVI